MAKKLIIILILSSLLISGSYYLLNPKSLIIIGGNYYPSAYLENGEIKGYYPEVLKTILNKQKIPYEIKLYPWDQALEKMKLGEGDIMIPPSYNKNRESFLDYLDEQKNYEKTGILSKTALSADRYKAYTKKEIPKIDTLKSIKENNYKVGIIKKFNYYEDFWDARLDIYIYQDTKKALMDLNEGLIDVFVMLDEITNQAIIELNLTEKITAHEKILHFDPSYIVFSKKTNFFKKDKIKENFYKELIRMKDSGELNEIYKKYYKSDMDF